MNISCDLCQAKYAVPDTKVRGRKVKITCKHCGATLIVDGTADEVSVVAVRDEGPAHLATTALDRASPFAEPPRAPPSSSPPEALPAPTAAPPPTPAPVPAVAAVAPATPLRSESPGPPAVMPATRPPSLPDDDAWAAPLPVPPNPAPRFDFAGVPAGSPARESSRPPQAAVAVPAIAAPVAPAAGAQRLGKKTLLGGLDRPAPGAAPAPPPAPPPPAPPPPPAVSAPPAAAAAPAPKLAKKTMLGGLSAPLPSVRGVFDIDSTPDAAPTPLVPAVTATPPAAPVAAVTATPPAAPAAAVTAPPTLATPSPSVALSSAPGTVAVPSDPHTIITSHAPSTLATPSLVAQGAERNDTLGAALEPSLAAPAPLPAPSVHATQESPAFIHDPAPPLDIPVVRHSRSPERELASTLPAMQAHPELASPARDVIPRVVEPRIDERSATPAPVRVASAGAMSSTLPQGVAPRAAKKASVGGYVIGALVLGSGAVLGAYLADEGPSAPPGRNATASAAAPATRPTGAAPAATASARPAGAATVTPSVAPAASAAPSAAPAAGAAPSGAPAVSAAPTAPSPSSDAKPRAFDPAAANEALTTAAGSVASCASPGRTAAGKVAIIFANDGSVKHANVISNEASVATKKCVERVFREAHIPAFVGAPVTVSRAFYVR